ncbi:STAS domain-containing protein [Streptomyces filamentosus]|uniref:STAS domain-containing protein n=1 Tax=Streptomyces filamentosus TaxID=67294 RepID=UPI0036E208FD
MNPSPVLPGPEARLRVGTERDGGGTVVRVGGEIDPDTADEPEAVLARALSEGDDGTPLVLDLSEVSSCDSTGLDALPHPRLPARRRRTPFAVSAASAQVVRPLGPTRTGGLLGSPVPPGRPP